jgi:hypothetical protein
MITRARTNPIQATVSKVKTPLAQRGEGSTARSQLLFSPNEPTVKMGKGVVCPICSRFLRYPDR